MEKKMKDGFFRVAAVTPEIRVADPEYNRGEICRLIEEGTKSGVAMMVFPELCLTAYTCGDLFLQMPLIKSAREELLKIAECTTDKDMLVFVGLPWEHGGKLYNVAAVLSGGKLLGIVPKTHLPNYSEFYEQRHFTAGMESPVMTGWQGGSVPMGSRLLFQCREFPADLSGYDLIIQCGACMYNRKYVLSRVEQAKIQGVPMTNYGVVIAHLTGILDKIAAVP